MPWPKTNICEVPETRWERQSAPARGWKKASNDIVGLKDVSAISKATWTNYTLREKIFSQVSLHHIFSFSIFSMCSNKIIVF